VLCYTYLAKTLFKATHASRQSVNKAGTKQELELVRNRTEGEHWYVNATKREQKNKKKVSKMWI